MFPPLVSGMVCPLMEQVPEWNVRLDSLFKGIRKVARSIRGEEAYGISEA
jgi:hypothetical protein